MTKLANEQGATDTQENLQDAVYPSPGGSDEFVPIFMSRNRMSRNKIDDLRGRFERSWGKDNAQTLSSGRAVEGGGTGMGRLWQWLHYMKDSGERT
jgi:hypothetical protein